MTTAADTMHAIANVDPQASDWDSQVTGLIAKAILCARPEVDLDRLRQVDIDAAISWLKLDAENKSKEFGKPVEHFYSWVAFQYIAAFRQALAALPPVDPAGDADEGRAGARHEDELFEQPTAALSAVDVPTDAGADANARRAWARYCDAPQMSSLVVDAFFAGYAAALPLRTAAVPEGYIVVPRDATDAALAMVVPEPTHLYLGRDQNYINRMKAATAADRLTVASNYRTVVDAMSAAPARGPQEGK